ncbi:hypothetical protein ACJQWK_02170 [Exserohilum turcicum]|uniref:Uncharacterized protein n=1 Tax=Exserohilum turcicum (strain 28A) TaxID=671987 RepID=R0K621_EXST2|nr:uncharacterized protein SETTUDRAFT_27275 [Exserohilum turcica Et28A]EOA88468.1 hypothetical protein SETTUDRAFT_27275 [Exserohilum turcica Et28A]
MRARASIAHSAPALLLLASAAVAQGDTTTVVVATSPFVSPTPSSVDIFTIQTSMPAEDPWACYEACLMPPCPSSCSVSGSMGLPLPPPVSESVVSVITDSFLSTVTGAMSIPAGETALSSGASQTPTPSTPSGGLRSTGSPTRSGTPQVTSSAAALDAKAPGMSLVAVVAGALALL